MLIAVTVVSVAVAVLSLTLFLRARRQIKRLLFKKNHYKEQIQLAALCHAIRQAGSTLDDVFSLIEKKIGPFRILLVGEHDHLLYDTGTFPVGHNDSTFVLVAQFENVEVFTKQKADIELAAPTAIAKAVNDWSTQTRDPLTRCFNRLTFQKIAIREELRHERFGHPYSVILIDLDDFKSVNDRFGHDAGDSVLSQMGKLFLTHTREGLDAVARWGGEEFLILAPETNQVSAVTLANKIRRRTESQPLTLPDGSTLRVTVSVGVATLSDGASYKDLVKKADEALYKAKKTGKNRVVEA